MSYKPSTVRSYEQALRLHVYPDLGGLKLSTLTRLDVQDLVDRLHAKDLGASTVRNAIMPLRAIVRRAMRRGELSVNPTHDLDLPAVTGRRERVATPEEAARLIAVLSVRDRALWAMAFYAGLRAGELQALRWEDVDLANSVIRVERSWDKKEGPVAPKSRAGRRTVPISGVLRDHLDEHRIQSEHTTGLVFGRTPGLPLSQSGMTNRAKRIWNKNSLDPIGLHEARHTYASLMIAAGVNIKAISTYMGHSSVTITYDRYGHLLPGNENVAAAMLDNFIAEQTEQAARAASPPASSN